MGKHTSKSNNTWRSRIYCTRVWKFDILECTKIPFLGREPSFRFASRRKCVYDIIRLIIFLLIIHHQIFHIFYQDLPLLLILLPFLIPHGIISLISFDHCLSNLGHHHLRTLSNFDFLHLNFLKISILHHQSSTVIFVFSFYSAF